MTNSSYNKPLLPEKIFSALPEDVYRNLCFHLDAMITYEPVIGLMGKTGVGKSSLCNTLFNPPPAKVDAVMGCSRRVERYKVIHGSHTLHIADFPGIAETPELDTLYQQLYLSWSSKLDLIVWVLKADERAWKDDIRSYHELTEAGADPQCFLFVISQADKMEPCREWDTVNHQPSPRQLENLQAKSALASTLFATVHPVIAVSAVENYNLHLWVEALFLALPSRCQSAVSRHLNSVLRTENVKGKARESFVQVTGEIFDDAISSIQTSGVLIVQLRRLRSRLLSVVRAVWHLLF